MKPTKKNILYMLEQSNNIEDVWDKQSLDEAYDAWCELFKEDTLTVKSVLSAHGILMANQHIARQYKGDFRDVPIRIGYTVKSLSKIVIKSLIEDLINDINKNTFPSDCLMHHLQFEGIHPFIDGNGRMGRIILNWELVKKCRANLLVFKESEKYEKYYPLFSN